MNSYEHKRRWKFLLLVCAIAIGCSSLLYTNFLVKELALEEKEKVELWVKATSKIIETEDSEFLVFLFDEIISETSVAIIQTDSIGVIKSYRGLDEDKTLFPAVDSNKKYDPDYFDEQLAIMKSQHEPIVYRLYEGDKEYIYYKDSAMLTQLRYYPYVQLSIIAIFLFASYVAFSASRRSEQNQVWVGMAKETAHQLGTPISSLLAWMEHLKSKASKEDLIFLLEMENDIQRLELVTERFSKIGSKPVLIEEPVKPVIEQSIDYISKRSSNKILFEVKGSDEIKAKMNVPLFDWVIENLCKNAINAIGVSGKISISILKHKRTVYIDVKDTGKGIPKSKFQTVFQPGYTTRKRGWGLGLSLVKRIVENYHSGQIYVKESEIGKGTTFRIALKS